jgi:hypothetical protein
LVEVFRETARVLRPDGTLWLNLGDSYVGGGRAGKNPEYQAQHTMFGKTVDGSGSGQFGLPMGIPEGLKPKDLAGIPWRVAFALQADGWYLRSAIPWIKRNCMPSSQTDRPTTGVEYVFLFSHPDSGGKYYYDIDATRVSPNTKPQRRLTARREHSKGGEAAPGAKVRPPNYETSAEPTVACTPNDGRNRRDTDWFFESVEHVASGGQGLLSSEDGSPLAFVVNPKPYKGAHFAVWPQALVEPMIRAGSSEHGVCADCGAPWTRDRAKACSKCEGTVPANAKSCPDCGHVNDWKSGRVDIDSAQDKATLAAGGASGRAVPRKTGSMGKATVKAQDVWQPFCLCSNSELPVRATVLDPFSGSATTGLVALQEGRNYIGLDLNPHYLPLAEARVQELPAPVADEADSSGDILDLFGGGN